MDGRMIGRIVLVSMMSIGFVMVSKGMAYAASDSSSLNNVKKEVAEAAESIKRYSVDQRDEAIEKAKAVMDSLDAKIDKLRSSIEKDWDKMDQAARHRASATLDKLETQRRQLAESYTALKESSASAWGDVKNGFSDSYTNLHEAWEKAEYDFKKSK